MEKYSSVNNLDDFTFGNGKCFFSQLIQQVQTIFCLSSGHATRLGTTKLKTTTQININYKRKLSSAA